MHSPANGRNMVHVHSYMKKFDCLNDYARHDWMELASELIPVMHWTRLHGVSHTVRHEVIDNDLASPPWEFKGKSLRQVRSELRRQGPKFMKAAESVEYVWPESRAFTSATAIVRVSSELADWGPTHIVATLEGDTYPVSQVIFAAYWAYWRLPPPAMRYTPTADGSSSMAELQVCSSANCPPYYSRAFKQVNRFLMSQDVQDLGLLPFYSLMKDLRTTRHDESIYKSPLYLDVVLRHLRKYCISSDGLLREYMQHVYSVWRIVEDCGLHAESCVWDALETVWRAGMQVMMERKLEHEHRKGSMVKG
ncbi:hypothetical protein GLOTRDRAFT_96037 [Gloeophyllum trabeum ATCC 11539]|uniref:Uncharacterized protein n=1 Tax=Gloeophyllum trabeum (strain ATCC 11539 / FP-39264 / Madison 617) TaxID=670483 RepID=S7RGS5_GLOTA|nr:uncharacterized protein GLOTRDRAFT_96037 [Gloeophyllum trabeum ATCC 11539]EPQ51769.1 hypothetical protein GLOTRDRAFT_96037 [Gloeophyllum trabeum ATCC 11539]